MHWDLISRVAELIGTMAIIVTLVYLTLQIRQTNRQTLLTSFQSTFGELNEWCRLVSESPDLGAIVLKGRDSYTALDDAERFRFDHVHIHLLNIIEAHLYQVHQTAMDSAYRDWAMKNMGGIASGYLRHPGTREFWSSVEDYWPEDVRELVRANIGGD